MRKIRLFAIVLLLMISVFPAGRSLKVAADSYYSFSCDVSQFEVSYIKDDGSFKKISCHNSFSAAKKAMKADKDYVVRYSKSYSPTLIVAMNSGLAYTYPGRRNSSTMNLYQDPLHRNDSTYKTTYVANHYEMIYVDTCGSEVYDITGAGKGYIRVILNGFEGFTDLEYTDLVPSKFLEKGLPIWLGGRNAYEGEDPFQVVPCQNYYQIEKNGNYYDLVFHFYRAYPSGGINGNGALSYRYSVDNAENYLAAGMKTGVKYYSADGIVFYSDASLSKKVATVYNYYQFLPLRTRTNISASSFDAFMKKMKGNSSVMASQANAFISGQEKYGCNALLIYAMACLESAYGTSGYATNRNNLFGWSAYDDSPDDASYFSSVKNCVYEQMGRNLNWFLDYTNRRYFGSCVGNKGSGINVLYASDPYWGIKIASIAYSIDKYANGNNGQLSDHNSYTLAYVHNNYNDVLYDAAIEWDTKIYKKAKGSSVLYTGRFGTHYQKDLVVALLEQDGNRYKIQSTNPVKNGSINTEDGVLVYDWNASVGYIDIDKADPLYGKTVVQINDDDQIAEDATFAPLTSLRNLSLENGILRMDGVGAIQGMDFSQNSDKIAHYIVFHDLNSSEVLEYQAVNIDSQGYTNYDDCDYTYAGFAFEKDLTDGFRQGSYYVELKTVNGDHSVSVFLYSSDKDLRLLQFRNDDLSIISRMNESFDYRLEIDVLSLPEEIDVSLIRKPSARTSLLALHDISLSDDGVLSLEAHGYMYYLDHTSEEDVSYEVYLVADKDNYLKLDTVLYDDGVDYKEELGSNYDLKHICFRSSADISTLEGDYTIYVVMRNKADQDYLDICELINYGFDLPEKAIDDKVISIYTSPVRKRIGIRTD